MTTDVNLLSTKHWSIFVKDNTIIRNTTFKDILISLYGTIAFFNCTFITYRFGNAQDQPRSTFFFITIFGSCTIFITSLLLNLPRPDRYRIFGLISMLTFYVGSSIFFIWYSNSDCYSSFAWAGLLVTLLFTVTNLDKTFDPQRIKDIEKILFQIIRVGLEVIAIWMLIFAYLWLIDHPVFHNEFWANAVLTCYGALGFFWFYWEIVSLRIRERVTRETAFFLRRYNHKSIANTLSKMKISDLKIGHPLSIQVIQSIKKAIIDHPLSKTFGLKLLEDWRQNFGKPSEIVIDRALIIHIFHTYSEISARLQLRVILNNQEAYYYERMLAFRELTDLSLDEKGAIDPFEYVLSSDDIVTFDIFKMLMELIKKGLKIQKPQKYMAALHRLDSLLYQYLHDGIKHIVMNQLESHLTIGDFQGSEPTLEQMIELSHNIFKDIDDMLDVPIFTSNLERLKQYKSQPGISMEDSIRLFVVYARKLSKKCQFLRTLIQKQQSYNIHQIINAVIEQKRNTDIEIVKAFEQNQAHIPPETDAAFEIICEENLIHQALVNLVNNSIAAMTNSKIKQLIFKTEQIEEQVVVSVIDTGCGIPAERRIRLFLEGSGLKIARNNIEIHGGKLALERSEINKGSVFSIRLLSKLPNIR